MKTQRQSLETSARIGRQLVEEKKAAVKSGEASLEKGKGLDLLSMVGTCHNRSYRTRKRIFDAHLHALFPVRANMDPDLKDNQRMSDAEVIATIQTFVLAGAETSSTALTWALWELAQRPEVQGKLREECLGVADSEPTMYVLLHLCGTKWAALKGGRTAGPNWTVSLIWTPSSTKSSA